jgi:hypothetical protein
MKNVARACKKQIMKYFIVTAVFVHARFENQNQYQYKSNDVYI